MATAGPALPERHTNPLVYRLGEQEQSVLSVLLANRGRVIGRRELARRAGLLSLSERRCDSLLVAIRRALGPQSVVTVRSRGWMLSDEAIDAASALAGDRP
jgi:DNA-binding winged helix-turn-helix (wHTH) protein